MRIIKNHDAPKSNITKPEREALLQLAKDDTITILPADKGRAVVVMNTADYKTKATAILSDTTTYQVLKRDPTPKYTDQVVKKLQELKQAGSITDIEYKRLYPTSSLIPRFYGLPKVHKTRAPLRPIVASRGSITYQVARKVADILAPLVGCNGFALNNSAHLVNELKDIKLDEDEVDIFRCHCPLHLHASTKGPGSDLR